MIGVIVIPILIVMMFAVVITAAVILAAGKLGLPVLWASKVLWVPRDPRETKAPLVLEVVPVRRARPDLPVLRGLRGNLVLKGTWVVPVSRD